MEKIKGKYDLNIDTVQANQKTLVVDSELLFNVYTKGFLFWKTKHYELTEFHRKFLRYLKLIQQQYDLVYLATIGDKEYKRSIADLLHLTILVVDFETEMNYQTWLKMVNPKDHFATLKRRHYYRNSIYITEDILK